MKPASKLSWGGLFKTAIDRFRVYVTYIQLLMILQLYLKQEGWHSWYLWFIPVSLIVIYLDVRFMLRGEQQAIFDIHPYLPKMKNDIEEIKEKVDELSHLSKVS